MKKKEVALGVFVDFTKAFDLLNHSILLKKLDAYGIRGDALRLLTSYLENRQQYVYLNGFSSDKKTITSGVPQGSILGPLLFNIYLNDIICINPNIKHIIYADDTTMLLSAACPNDLISEANSSLSRLHEWSSANALKINTAKTKAILFRPRNKSVFINTDLLLGDSKIEILPVFKTLGVVFNENLTWDDHVEHVVSKISSVVGVTCINKELLPVQVKVILYNTLFHSHISYAHLVWGTTTVTNLRKILTVQKRMLRHVLGVPRDHPSLPLFEKLKIMKITQMYPYRLCLTYINDVKENKLSLSFSFFVKEKPFI